MRRDKDVEDDDGGVTSKVCLSFYILSFSACPK